ncbi:MAG: glycosyltransferase N-terminal domain-containing protein [Bacteroidota bacterium]
MRIIYDIGIRLYWLVAWIISPWNHKAKLWLAGRKGWLENLKQDFTPAERVIWFHCASLGEFEQGRTLIEESRRRFPEHRILLTFFSPSGYEKRKNYQGADHVMYLPLDTARNARQLVDSLSFEMAIFIKYEFWYHFLRRLKKREIPVYLASGNFRSNQLFFKWYGRWYRRFLDYFTQIFVQLEASKKLLEQEGFNRVSVAGDTRFDRVKQLTETDYNHALIEEFSKDSQVIVAGSTWERDEQILEHAFGQLHEDTRLIIAPHELSESHLSRLKRRFPESIFFTELDHHLPKDTRVIIVDTIGQLSYLYRYGTLAYIGGGFGKGIHNTLEAATYGLPVIFGPAYHKFSEAVELSALSAAFPVNDEEELLLTIHQQLKNPNLLKTTSRISENYVLERVGATSAIMDQVCIKSEPNML